MNEKGETLEETTAVYVHVTLCVLKWREEVKS